MSTPTPVPAPTLQVPDSPHESESPPPPGLQGDLEMELLSLATALYHLGTTVVNDLTKEKDKPGGGGKPVGTRVNDVIYHLATLESMSESLDTMIPMQVLVDIDNSRNPMLLTKDRLERAATENQFMNGKIHAIDSYRKMLDEALVQNFPELEDQLAGMDGSSVMMNEPIKVEEDGEGLSNARDGLPNGV